MSQKTETIHKFRIADIRDDDFPQCVLRTIEDKYARGFLSAKVSQMNDEDRDYREEEFREDLIEVCNWDIWDK